jgi:hypothetical protein
VAVSHRLPAVTGNRRDEARGASPSPALEAQRTGLVKRPKTGDLGRSARLPCESPHFTGGASISDGYVKKDGEMLVLRHPESGFPHSTFCFCIENTICCAAVARTRQKSARTLPGLRRL